MAARNPSAVADAGDAERAARNPKSGPTDDPISTPTQSRQGPCGSWGKALNPRYNPRPECEETWADGQKGAVFLH